MVTRRGVMRLESGRDSLCAQLGCLLGFCAPGWKRSMPTLFLCDGVVAGIMRDPESSRGVVALPLQ